MSTFVAGGPVVGVAAVLLVQLLVLVAGGVASWWYEVAATPPRPRRRELFGVIPRTTLVVGVCAIAALMSVWVYGLLTTAWLDPVRPRTISALVGSVAAFSALFTYGTSRLRDRHRAMAERA